MCIVDCSKVFVLKELNTVVWEKLEVGNIHEIKIRGKKIFVLAG